jgi:hypothetical protein
MTDEELKLRKVELALMGLRLGYHGLCPDCQNRPDGRIPKVMFISILHENMYFLVCEKHADGFRRNHSYSGKEL